MDNHLAPGDPLLVENIVSYLKAMGIFDEFRHECLADVDTKSSCQNLSQRVDGYTAKFLSSETWNPDLNKNEMRNKLRKHIDESGMLAVGADHVVEQVINPKIQQLFLPRIIEVVHQYLNKEKEKLNKKQELTNSEKLSAEATTKTKTTVLDPIADILSFTYTKPKQVTSTSIQNVQTKVIDIAKVDKKKEEGVQQTKVSDAIPKVEKKKEEITQQVKGQDILPKIKKEEVTDPTATSDLLNAEKKEDFVNLIKTETIELSKEGQSITVSHTKSPNDSKDPGKIAKEIKLEEFETVSVVSKKTEKDDVKQEKKKMDNLKLQVPEKLPLSEECENKLPNVSKNNLGKNSVEPAKHKKNKPFSSLKSSIKVGESHKSKTKESPDLSREQNKVSSKILKFHSKDQSSSPKNNASAKVVKNEKGEDSGSKNKSKSIISKSSDKTVTLKVSSVKKEDSFIKLKHSPDKHGLQKPLKTSDSKFDKVQSESSSNSDKGNRTSSQYSSSYESSQGSDPDRSSASSVGSKEKVKHFSKHHRKESSSDNSIKTKSQSDSDSGTPKKDKEGKLSKYATEKRIKYFSVQESAKISSRSNSLGSASSTSDSQTSLKETSLGTSSEASNNSSKHSEKKKKHISKEKEPCMGSQNLPPPSPPPPTSGFLTQGTSSAEMSSMDDTQSSQGSESDVSENSDDEISSESDAENYSSTNNQKCSLKEAPELFNDIYDIFLYSSSSSEFEGYYSSFEKTQRPVKYVSDVSVTSVHTSDLSSFDDELSDVECSSDLPEEQKSKKRFTIKEAEEILKAKAEQHRLKTLKSASQETTLNDKRKPKSSRQISVLPSGNEVFPPPEPKRESRRERKLNPKYASSEYTSIFDSKRTSFITKQVNQCQVKQTSNTDVKKTEADFPVTKDKLPVKRKTTWAILDTNHLHDVELKTPPCTGRKVKKVLSEPSVSSECATVATELDSEEISLNSDTKTNFNVPDKNHNTLAETDSQYRVALKIKLSASKNDNETNKDPNTRGTKRKFEDDEKVSCKKTCRLNSVNSSSSESVANENKPFNNKTNDSSVVTNSKAFLKQKVNNNGDVLSKVEQVKKNAHTKPNHINETQPGD